MFRIPSCSWTLSVVALFFFFCHWANKLRQNANQLLLWKPLRGPSDLLTDRPLWLSLQVSACLSVSCSLKIYSILTLHLKVHYLSWEQNSLEETSAGVKLITDCFTIVTLLVYIQSLVCPIIVEIYCNLSVLSVCTVCRTLISAIIIIVLIIICLYFLILLLSSCPYF